MARLPQFERDPDLTRELTAVKAAIKHLTPADRTTLLAWLAIYYDDTGNLFASQNGRRRKRITLDEIEYWLVRVPRRK